LKSYFLLLILSSSFLPFLLTLSEVNLSPFSFFLSLLLNLLLVFLSLLLILESKVLLLSNLSIFLEVSLILGSTPSLPSFSRGPFPFSPSSLPVAVSFPVLFPPFSPSFFPRCLSSLMLPSFSLGFAFPFFPDASFFLSGFCFSFLP
jgi:hypothetical protein